MDCRVWVQPDNHAVVAASCETVPVKGQRLNLHVSDRVISVEVTKVLPIIDDRGVIHLEAIELDGG